MILAGLYPAIWGKGPGLNLEKVCGMLLYFGKWEKYFLRLIFAIVLHFMRNPVILEYSL